MGLGAASERIVLLESASRAVVSPPKHAAPFSAI